MTNKRSIKWLVEAPDKANLADDLTPAELSALAQDVIRCYDLDRGNRREWDEQSARALKLAKQVLEKKSTPWVGAANIKHPLITISTIQFAARAYPEICKGNKVVKCLITGDDPPAPPSQPQAPPAMPGQSGQPMPPQMAAGPAPMAPMTPQGPMAGPPEMPKASPKRQRADRIQCYSHDTEVLTALGWKYIWEIIPGTYVYSRRPDGTASYDSVSNITSYHADNLVHVRGASVDLLVTENHNMLVEDHTTGETFFKHAGDFVKDNTRQRLSIPLTSISRNVHIDDGDFYDIPCIAYLRLLGWYISEGSAQYSRAGSGTRQINASVGSFVLSQSKVANPEKYAQMLLDIETCGLSYSEREGGVTLHAKSMPNGLKQELRSLGKVDQKFVPRHVMHCSPQAIEQFLDTLLAGDGHTSDRGYQSFTTVSRQLADDVQELCQLIGKRGTISKKLPNIVGDPIAGRPVKSRRTRYDVRIGERDKALTNYITWEIVPYDNQVFCCEVNPWHTLYVRRNGRAAWCGNSHMNWQLTQEITDWEADMDCLLHVLPVVGQCYKKTYFSSQDRHNISELVLPDDCVVSKGRSRDIKKARRITHRLWIYTNEAVEKFRKGIWTTIDMGMAPTTDNDTDAPHEFLEQHRWDDLDGDGYKEPYIVTVHKTTAKVVRVAARWIADNIEVASAGKVGRIKPDHYFTHYGFIPNPDGSMNALGFGQLLEPINASVNTTLNQLLDSGTLYNSGGGFIGRGIKLRGGTFSFRPGEFKVVDCQGGLLKENIVPLPVKEPSVVLFQLLGFLVQMGQDISSVQNVLTGDAKLASTMPVGTMMALVEQGLKVFTAIYKRIYRSLSEEFKKLYILNTRFLDPKFTFFISGHPEQFVERADYVAGDTLVIPVADPELSSDMQRLLKSQALKEVSGRPGLNEVEVTRRMIRAVRPENMEELLLTDGQISGKEPTPWKPPPPPQQVLAQAKAQRMMQQAQESQTRLKMDFFKFKLELQELESKIANTKADTMLKLAKAEDTGRADYLELYRAEMQSIEKEIELKLSGLKKGVDNVTGQGNTGNAGGIPGLAESPDNTGNLTGSPG